MPLLETFVLTQDAATILLQLQDTLSLGSYQDGPRGWLGFSDWRLMLRVSMSFLVAIGLASSIAFHPSGSGRARDPEDLERPRTLLLYAVVGALVAEIVVVSPPMALVVFGIGGLLRFRTDAGAASDTGRVILVTIVGMATGLSLFPFAVLATVGGWLLIFVLQSRPIYRVELEEVADDRVADRLKELARLLVQAGYAVISQSRSRLKGEVLIVVRGPRGVGDEVLDDLLFDYQRERECRVRWKAV